MSTAELIRLLRPLRSRVKLAVVSACESAAATTAETLRWLELDDPAAELEAQAAQDAPATPERVARALVAELGCAVIAMRYPVTDDFAIGFADALYDRVFRQDQTLDRAVAAVVPAVMGPAPAPDRPALSVATPALFGASAARMVLTPPKGKPSLDPEDRVMAGFPPEPPRFVGRTEPMAAASAALAPKSGRTAVVFHGMAGAGKTACALELAYRHQRVFEALAFWSAPTDPEQFGDALLWLAVAWEAQLGNYGFAMVDKIATLADLDQFLPRLRALLQDTGLLRGRCMHCPGTNPWCWPGNCLTCARCCTRRLSLCGDPVRRTLRWAAGCSPWPRVTPSCWNLPTLPTRSGWPPSSRRRRPPWTGRRCRRSCAMAPPPGTPPSELVTISV